MAERDESDRFEPFKLERVGGFEIISKIAEGGMGAVYRARQVSLDRTVAVKILPKRLAKDEQFVGRFLREAKLAAQFSHPNIVGAVDAGKAEGVHYFAMEYVEGESLGEMVSREKVLSEAKAVEVIAQMARALECAHKHGMVHRDVKPDNILIDEEGTAKLADLGLAKQVADEGTQLTQAGTAMGSPHYISPEQARGEDDIDIRADIYSLGATFYQIVTGQTAFSGQTVAVIMTKHLNEVPPPVREVRPEVSEATASVVAKMMAKDRSERYQTPAELLADLERLSRGEEPDARGTEATFLMDVGDLPPVRKGLARSLVFTALIVSVALALLGTAGLVIVLSGGGGAEREEFARLFEEGKALFGAGKLGRAKGVLESARALAGEGEEAARAKDLLREVELALEERNGRLKAAADELAAVEGLIADGNLDEAVKRGRAGAERFPEKREAFEELAARAEKLLEEKRVADAFEAARVKAEGLMRRKAYAEAAEAFAAALEIKDDREVRARRTEALFLDQKARGETAEAAGRLEDAITFYEKAIGILPAPELPAHVKGLRRALAVAKRIALAEELERAGDFAGAREQLEAALEIASAEETKDLSRRIRALALKEKALAEAVAEARSHLDACRLDRCVAQAEEALRVKPGDAEATRLVAAAKERMVVRNSIGMTLVYLPGSEFTMGSGSGDADERPPHPVRLSHFYISKTEVTNQQYERFRPDHSSQRKYSEADDCPAVRVNWYDAKKFCDWLSEKEGVRYSLPTEAQWEYAATGAGRNTPYSWGTSSPETSRCNIGWGEKEEWAADGDEFAAPVGSFRKGASPQGLVDLIGNVWEWCGDWYSADYYGTDAARGEDPLGPATGKEKVLRGGSFFDPPEKCRSRYRSTKNPAAKAANFGFRIVRDAAQGLRPRGRVAR